MNTDQADKIVNNDYEWTQPFLRDLFLTICGDGNAEYLNDVIKRTYGRYIDFPTIVLDDEGEVSTKNRLLQLQNDGLSIIGQVISDEQVAEVVANLLPKHMHDIWDSTSPRFTYENKPENLNVANYFDQDVINAPYLLQIANHPSIIRLIQAYLGVMPTIEVAECWWSFASADAPKQAQLFHGDYHGGKFVKLFVYLTDVDGDSGPHTYVKMSHRKSTINEKLESLKLADLAKYNVVVKKLGQRDKNNRFIESDVFGELFGKDKVVDITGQKGTCFIEDTSGIHRGLKPRARDRLVFQVTYTSIQNFKDPNPMVKSSNYIDKIMTAYPPAVSG